MKYARFSTILGDCQVTNYMARKVDLHWRSIGRITLPSGRLIVSDGAMAGRGAMLARRISAREHEVRIAVMAGEDRIAFALLEVSGRACNEIVRWEPALFEDGPPNLEEPGYSVDTGTGCFCAVEAAEAQRAMGGDWINWWEGPVAAELAKSGEPGGDWAVIAVGNQPPGFAIFSSGFGDGVYASYWGLDRDGEPVALLTDFGMVGGEGWD